MKKLMKILALAIGVAAGVCAASAQTGQRMATARSAMGQAIPAAQVYVCTKTATVTLTATPPCSPEVTIYSDTGLSAPITQPVLTNGNGAYVYYATAGTIVTEVITGAQINAQSQTVVIGGGGGAAFVYTGVHAGIPATCSIGQVAFITDATAGQNQYNCTATNVWTQNLNSGVPAVPSASVQLNIAGIFGSIPGFALDSPTAPTVLNLPFSEAITGPAPWADIKQFGATPRQGSPQTTTATTVSGSPNVTLTSAIDFKSNEYVVLLAGNPNPNAAPAAPVSVTSPAVSGTNTITYTLVGRVDNPGTGIGMGGLTPVSAGTSTTTSPAIFGPVPISISSATASAGSVTVNATGINCTTSTHIHVVGLSGSGATWNGFYLPTTGGTNSCIYSVSGATGTATVTGATVVLTNAAIPTSITRSTAGVISITTDVNHNYVATASPNQTLLIMEGSSTADCNGQYLIATASGTSITTVATGLTPATTETCGLVAGATYVQVWEKNVITAPAYANGITQYYVYSNNPAATHQPIGETDPGSLIFRDYGPVVTNQFVPASYVPSTPPVADTNSLFVAKITAGAGTTALTLNANVPTTQSTPVLAEHDDSQAILAACNTMSQSGTSGGGEVLISAPSAYNFGRYILNYPLTLPQGCGLVLATRVIANETMTLGLGSPLRAAPAPTYTGTPAQGSGSYAVISGIANPMVATLNGVSDGNQIEGINFVAGSSQQRMLYIRTQTSKVTDDAFQALNNCYATDIVYEGQSGGIQGLSHNTFNTGCTGIPPTGGYLPEAPAIWIRADAASGTVPAQFTSDGANQWAGGGVMVDSRLRTTGGLIQYHFSGINEDQEPTTPFLYVYGGNISGAADWQVGGVTMDSQGEACFGNFATNTAIVWLMGCDVSASQGSLVTGNSIAGLTIDVPVTTGRVGSTNYNLADANGLTTFALTAPVINWPASPVTGYTATAQNGGPLAALPPGLPDSINSPVSTANYTIACDSSTTLIDRAHTIQFVSGAATPIVPLSTAVGCGGAFVTRVLDVSAGTLVFSASGSDTFTVLNGSTTSSPVTTFSLTNGQFATLTQSKAGSGVWVVTIPGGGGGAGPNFTTPITVAPPSGTTTSYVVYPESTAGLGLMPLQCTSTSAATSIACATPKAIQIGQSIIFGYMYASGSATITSTGPNDSLGNPMTCSAPVTPGVASMVWCYVNNSAAAGIDTVTLTVSASVTGQWISGEVYQGFVTSSAVDGSAVSASGNNNTPSSGAYTSTNANDLIVTMIGSTLYLNTYALGGGFNERVFTFVNGASQNGGILFADQLATSTGSFTGSLTLPANLSGRWIASTVGFKLTAAPAVADMGGSQTPDSFPLLNTDFFGNTQFKKLATNGAYALGGPGGLPGGVNFLSTQNGPCWIFTATTSDCLNAADGQLTWGNNINIQTASGILKAASANLNVSTGTAPLTVTSTTPVANLAATPTTYNAAGTQQTNVHLVKDTCTLGTSCGITLAGSAIFTSSSSYDCFPRDATTPANAVTVTRTSGTALAFTGTGTDVINFVCVGD